MALYPENLEFGCVSDKYTEHSSNRDFLTSGSRIRFERLSGAVIKLRPPQSREVTSAIWSIPFAPPDEIAKPDCDTF